MAIGSLQDAQRNSYRDAGPGLTKQAVNVENTELNPVPVYIVPSATAVTTNIYSSVSSVASSSPTTIVSYTVPVGKKFLLQLIEGSGENISVFDVKLNAVPMARKRTYFGAEMNVDFLFASGLELSAGDVLILSVEHSRPFTSDYEGRILGIEDDA